MPKLINPSLLNLWRRSSNYAVVKYRVIDLSAAIIWTPPNMQRNCPLHNHAAATEFVLQAHTEVDQMQKRVCHGFRNGSGS